MTPSKASDPRTIHSLFVILTVTVACCTLLSLLVRPHGARAQELPHLLITEVYPAPLSGQTEWVELFNPTDFGLDMAGWTLEDQLSSPSQIAALSGHVMASELVYVPLNAAKLNNTADGVTFKNPDGEVVDSMSYTNTSAGMSWSRLGLVSPALWELTNATPNELTLANLFAPSPSPAQLSVSPSPGTSPSPLPTVSPNPTPTSTPNPSSLPSPTPSVSTAPQPTPAPNSGVILTITEIGACPESGQSEWVEVFNPLSTTIDVQDWYLTDASLTTQTITGSISPQQYQLFFWTRSLLNNSGDSLYLHDTSGAVVASATYTACETGQTLSLIDGMWQNGTPTPGKAPSQVASALSSPLSDDLAASSTATTDALTAALPPTNNQTHPSKVNSGLLKRQSEQTVNVLPWWPRVDISYVATPSLKSTFVSSSIDTADRETTASTFSTRNTIASSSPAPPRSAVANAIIGSLLLVSSSVATTVPMLRALLADTQIAHVQPDPAATIHFLANSGLH